MAKYSEAIIWLGRMIIGILVGIVIFNGLKTNPKFAMGSLIPLSGGIFGALLCIFLLFTIFKKS